MESELNDLKGNPSKRKPLARKYQNTPDEPPSYLDRNGKLIWRRLTPALRRESILNEATTDLVASMCQNFSTYLSALDHLNSEGRVITSATGVVKVNPWCAVEKQSWDMYTRGFRELKIAGEPIAPAVDELDAFLKKR